MSASKILIILLSSFFFYSLHAQDDVIRLRNCVNDDIKRQADSVKQLLTDSGGFVLMREAMITMESEYEMPVIVTLEAGQWYQVVFIGDIRSRLYELRMYDYRENEVMYKKHLWGDVDGNVINYPYIPKSSEFHMIKTLQVNKKQKKNLCGCIMLLRKKMR